MHLAAAAKLLLPAISRVVSDNAIFALSWKQGLGTSAGSRREPQRLYKTDRTGKSPGCLIPLGRKIGGPEAVQIGLATKCVPPRLI